MHSIKDWQRPDEGRLSRLPAWAKRYVSLLERAVEEQEALVAETLGDPVQYGERDDSKAYIQHGRDDGYREIPIHSRAIFQVPNVIRIRSARHD